MKKLLTILFLATYSLTANAVDLKSSFNKLNSTYKGPFGLNILQGPRGRTEVRSGDGGGKGGTLFQAAYRNDVARAMAEQNDFWMGNLFTTNYYELMGEYVYGNAYGSHELDHKRMADAAPKAIAKASSMVRHWVLEKHFLSAFPMSQIAKSFTYRGIADALNEQEYANYFFNFYVTAINDDYQYLPAFILVNRSPIVSSASLARARDLVAAAYDYYSGGTSAGLGMPSTNADWNWGFGSSSRGSSSNVVVAGGDSIAEMYKLRNAIHNQLTKDVVGQLDQFLAKYPQYKNDGYFNEIRNILVEYFSINASKVSAQAKKLGMNDIKAAADKVGNKATYLDGILELSRAAAGWRANISTKIAYENRAQALALLAQVSKILNKELAGMASANLKTTKALEAVVNTVYLEGFLIKDNWEYFQKEIVSTTAPGNLLADILDASTATLTEAFKPGFGQWSSIEPKMAGFMDATIKGSALNTVSVTIERLKKGN